MTETAASRPPASVVLLDLDGTLIDTRRLYIECYRQAVLPFVGRELTPEEIYALRPRSEFRFLRDVVGETRFEECLADFHRVYGRLHTEHFEGVFDGVPEMLATIRRRALPLGIVTGKSRRSWEITLEHAPLGDFDVLVFDDDVAEPKPDPQGIRIALETLGARPEDAIYLGDTATDMEAAAAAGVRPAAALWSRPPERREAFIERIRHLEPELLTAPAQFLDLLDVTAPHGRG